MDRNARSNIEVVRVGGLDAGEDLIIGGGGNHGGVIAGEFGIGEEEAGNGESGVFGGFSGV